MKNKIWKQLGWLILIWLSSISFLAIIAFFVRFLMTCAGLKE